MTNFWKVNYRLGKTTKTTLIKADRVTKKNLKKIINNPNLRFESAKRQKKTWK